MNASKYIAYSRGQFYQHIFEAFSRVQLFSEHKLGKWQTAFGKIHQLYGKIQHSFKYW